MTVWFARGVGLLKYVERQTIPSFRSNNDRLVEVIEVLEKVRLANDVASSNEPTEFSDTVLRSNFLGQKWLQAAMSSRLLPSRSRERLPIKEFVAHQ